MSVQLRLEDIRRAWEARDPELVQLVETLAEQWERPPEKPIREGAPTFEKYLAEIQSKPFRKKPKEEQAHYRVEQMKALEAPDAEVPLSDKLRLHEIFFVLWEDNSLFARQCLLKLIAKVPLIYGPWRALKKIFKEAEARDDTEILGALAARFDMAFSTGHSQVSRLTLGYLVRRAWRYLRRVATQLPVSYADICCDFLIHYTNQARWPRTWIANHIFYHQTGRYSRTGFSFWSLPDDILKNRAYAELWQRSPRPLFSLLERAQSEQVWKFAATALKTDFRSVLREVEPEWVARLVNVQSATIDDLVVWILSNVPRFEQAAFRDLGLHDAVLKLLDSPSKDARKYAADYARAHARDLPTGELIRLIGNNHDAVRKLAANLLRSRDPRKEIGLEAWGHLLETDHGHKLAAEMIGKHFGASELTPEWFRDRLLARHAGTFDFAKKHLFQIHKREDLGVAFFQDLIERFQDVRAKSEDWYYRYHYGNQIAQFAMSELGNFDPNGFSPEFLQRLLLEPSTSSQVQQWINEGKLKTQTIPVGFFKSIAFHPDWEEDSWIQSLGEKHAWAKDLSFNHSLSEKALEWLKDVRRFSTTDLGFEWLLKLVMRSEPNYHDFAVDTMSKSFVPADFAPQEKVEAEGGHSDDQVDLGGSSFLFTGKLATMNRKEAEEKVRQANGQVFSSVSSKLHYLVIGDEGSPLYGQGNKGSKQEKAEAINAKGGSIQIISETAFLQMLTEGQKSYSEDTVMAGCQRLWEMAIAPGTEDAPLARFARRYIRRHHPDLCLEKTDRPVDPGAEMPPAFFTLERVRPLFFESRKPLRDLALDLARWEFARWSPPVEDLIRLTESPYGEIRDFVAQSLLAEDSPEHQRYRIDPEKLSPSAVYSFCESPDEATRTLGMRLIQRSPRLQIPEELFRLTESPDRRVRAFVIRSLWSLYRDRGITVDWKPSVPPQPTTGAASRKEAEKEVARRGTGAPSRPERLPTEQVGLEKFLRRILFEIPPGRMESSKTPSEGILKRMKPLPARKAKLSLIEMMRDLALEEKPFAEGLLPLLEEFMQSHGKSEQEACLVAITRIKHRHAIRTDE